MSEEFFRVATQEIKEDLADISKLLYKCKTDSDISAIAGDLEKKMHKIKGLAPMMGKKEVGDLASLSSHFLQQIISGINIDKILITLKEFNSHMIDVMDGKQIDAKYYKDMMEKNSKYFDETRF